jgi:YrbI family 3-deoxy-D-manno-octulosonate 8-phosphate phosphatase
MTNDNLSERCRGIEWILSDVDGVMTDGGVIVSDRGEETVRFHIHDGLGVRIWRETGRRLGILTGRSVPAVRLRGEQLHADAFYHGADDKLEAFRKFLDDQRVAADQVCYVGDDLLDLAVLRRVGIAIAPANACAEVQEAVHHVTRKAGGEGALREAVEFLLKASGEWDRVVDAYRK